jgi:lipoate-protein ligase A
MERHRTALRPLLGEDCRTRGTTDLALGEQKFSGNAQRRRKRFLLFHGTFLHGFDLPSIARLLHFPSRQPEYRQGRSHLEFVRNVPVGSAAIKAALVQAWDAQQPLAVLPLGKIQHLVASRYGIEDWNRKF